MYIDRIDTSLLYRPFFNKVVDLIVNCSSHGKMYVLTSGLRTYDEQNALYAQGRTLPGNRVTNAQGGQSWHNFGIAVDFVYDMDPATPGLQLSWDPKDYIFLRNEAVKLGLESGLDWIAIKDAPHIQLPLSKNNITMTKLDALYKLGGAKSVFAELDKYKW